jgi:hypothetical protein
MNFYTVEDTIKLLKHSVPGNLIEFGVLNGNHASRLIKGGIEQGNPFGKVYLCDSWKGLPREAEGVWQNPDWIETAFSTRLEYGLSTDEECIDYVNRNIRSRIDPTYDIPPLQFVSGFFIDSLTEELANEVAGSISYAHIDCDIYLSTIHCMKWLFKYDVLKPDAIVRFDDWLYNKPPGGNNLAFTHITAKYNVLWVPLGDNLYVYKKHKRPRNICLCV